jgi:uncharacterized integral membrane protein
MKPKTVVIIIIAALMTIFVMQNTHPVALKILFWEPEFPLVVLIGFILVIGFVAGYVIKSMPAINKKDKQDF